MALGSPQSSAPLDVEYPTTNQNIPMAQKKTTNRKKTAPKKAAPKKKIAGKRYSDAEKAEIIDFVNEVNAAKNGRGGPSAAARKYGVSPISIGNWMKSTKTPNGPKGKKGGPKGPREKKGVSPWDELVQLKTEIASLETELAQKQARFDKVKTKI